MQSLRVAIVGAGPAGLVAAIAAQRAGFDCEVFERAQSFERIGGAIGVQTNGRMVLDALGLTDAFARCIEVTYQAGVEAPPGHTLSIADFRELDHPLSGFAVALRYDLQELLLETARAANVRVNFDHKCVGAKHVGERAELSFENGRTEIYDVVLACDGVHSAIRKSLPFKSRHRRIGEAYLRVIAPIEHPDRRRLGEFWAADGRRVGAFPLPAARTYVFCSVPIGRWQHILANDLTKWVQSWDDFGAPVSTLMHSITDWQSAVYDELNDLRVDRWSDGSVFLLGDAAHAMTPNLGQGANSAMMDALVLVNMLRRLSSIDEVRKEYERVRKPFVTRIQDAALWGGKAAGWRSAPARWLRNSLFSVATHITPMRKASLELTAGINPAEKQWL